MINKLLKPLKNNRGSMLPMIAVLVALSFLLGLVNFTLAVMYRDRALVRNALDAGTTSSLAAVAEEKFRAIKYGEEDIVTETVYIKCINKYFVGYDYWGYPEYETVDESFDAPRVIVWENTFNDIKNYIQLDVSNAEKVAKEYFEKNMKLNDLKYTVKDWSYSVTYDDKRIYDVKKDRTIVPVRPAFKAGRKPSGTNCDGGTPDIYNEVENPDEWWLSDFSGADTGSWTPPSGWTDAIVEENKVIFPRWAEVKASITVELPIPFGGFLGKSTYKANFDVTSYKELTRAN